MSWERVPLFLWLCGISGAAMLPVALLGAIDREFEAARPFLYGGLVTLALTLIVGLAMNAQGSRMPVRGQLLSLIATFTALPVILALPLIEAVPGMRFIDGYVEMISTATTTGLTVQSDPALWPRAVHFWRVETAWLGGLLIWVAAVAILAPLRIGGFELFLPPRHDLMRDLQGPSQGTVTAAGRVQRAFVQLAWVYLGLTGLLWLLLMVVGEAPYVALCHAMSTLSTSGISPVGGLGQGEAGLAGEAVIFVFFVFALTRRSFTRHLPVLGRSPIWQDPELRVAATAIALVTVVLFMRHWYALVETAEMIGLSLIPRAVWGAVFTATSFLTTTGFVSGQWEIARLWSGLSTPGMVLMGLALVGGGVATTAGGVKLLRIYVLYKHGQREISRLIHPSTVGGIGTRKRPVRQEAAVLAWLFFMLFALSITLSMMALALTGQEFEAATVMTLAAISNTGQLLDVATAIPIRVAELSDATKLVLCGAMALGRLETLALIAVLNPEFWRG